MNVTQRPRGQQMGRQRNQAGKNCFLLYVNVDTFFSETTHSNVNK